MRRQLTRLFLSTTTAAMLLASLHVYAQRVSDSELQFRAALRKQQLDGDLPGAIKVYQDIVAKSTDRTVKAKALLQLAIASEAQGRQAENFYQQIVKDFPEQPAAAQARLKLAALHPAVLPSTLTKRKIDFGPGVQNIVATDGQRAVYWDDAMITLFFGDVAGKSKKTVFVTTPDRKARAEVSRNFSTVFLYFSASQQRPAAYAVVKTDGSDYRELNLIENGAKLPAANPFGISWSRDNRYVLLSSRDLTDRNIHLLKISISDGQTVDLLGGRAASIIFAIPSPDDRYIAFQDGTRSIYVMPARGGQPRLIAETAGIADWTDDGKFLLLGADNAKKFSLYAIPMKDGLPAGERIFIQDVERMSRPISSGASMVFAVLPNGPVSAVSVSTLDQDGHLEPWKSTDLLGEGGFYPSWSPDARKVVYTANTLGERVTVARIHDFATGDDREVFRSSEPLTNCVWAAQHQVIYCGKILPSLQTEILSVDPDTRRATKIKTFEGSRFLRRLSADDSVLYMNNFSTGTGNQWEIGAEQETEANIRYVSPDGRWIYRAFREPDGRRAYQIRLTSEPDEDWRHMAYLKRQSTLGVAAIPSRYTPDSNWFVYHDTDDDGKDAFFRVPVSGGEPERMGDYPTSNVSSFIEVSRDGRHFLVEAPPSGPPPQPEFWLLQNFIPNMPAAAKR